MSDNNIKLNNINSNTINTNSNNKELALKILQEKSSFAFEGGGVLGIGHAGALYRLRELGGLKQINHLTGASVGSIMSAALACGATPEYIKEKMLTMNLTEFEDGENAISKCFGFIFKYGLNPGDKVEKFTEDFLEELTGNSDITFKEAYDRFGTHLTINYLSLRDETTKYADYIITPDMKIKKAIRWSSTIPLFYQPGKKYDTTGLYHKLSDLITDGGVLDNYPIHVLRDQGCKPRHMLGFKLYSSYEKHEYKVQVNKVQGDDISDNELPKGIINYGMKHVDILRKQALRYHVDDDDWKLTVKIDVKDYETTDFDIDHLDKMWLFKSGMKAVDKYLLEIEELLDKNEYPL